MALQPRSQPPHASALPKPFSFAPSQAWEGNDGPWSTFVITVGTPAQVFHVLISTIGQETWVPVPEGCIVGEDPPNCGTLRGVLPFQNQQSSGFLVNASTTWENKNLYQLDLEEHLNYTGNGQYGFDTVGLQLPNSGGVTLEHQVVAGIATKDFLLGIFALGPKPTNFTNFEAPSPSCLWTLHNTSQIPSLSWSYTAGAPYRQKKVPGSLTLGGYDTTRFVKNNVSFSFSADDSKPLTVGLQSISAVGTLQGTMSLLSFGVLAVLDSTVPEIWLPPSSCQIFESAFGLTYDPSTDRYLINSTSRAQLLQLNPILTFKLGNTIDGGDTVSIALPYKAFDLIADWPIYKDSTRYFPLRRAASEDMYTLGRTFFQEAYVIADYERSSFSISQALFPDNIPPDMTPIISPNTIFPSTSSSGLSKSALIGIIVGSTVVFLILITLIGLFIYRKRQKAKNRKTVEISAIQENDENRQNKHLSELPSPDGEMREKYLSGSSELSGQTRVQRQSERSELMAQELRHELVTVESPSELAGSPVPGREGGWS